MSEQRDRAQAAEGIEQRYVEEHAEAEELVEGLDPSNPDPESVRDVEALGDDAEQDVERMSGDDR